MLELNQFYYPEDLAKEVVEYFQVKSDNIKIKEQKLKELFEILYFTSLKTEELQSIKARIIFINKKNPDSNPPRRIVKDRWSYIKFKDDIELTVSNLVKISRAANPEVTSLAVDVIKNKWVIWGMIDQEHNYHNFILNESDSGPERPGKFYVDINNLGEISVHEKYNHIATLNKHTLIDKELDVFNEGTISKLLKKYIDSYIELVKDKVDKDIYEDIYEDRDHWDDSLKRIWISTLSRILIHIKEYRHGGAILIDENISYEDLNIKYNILYDRLSVQLPTYAKSVITSVFLEDIIFEEVFDSKKKYMKYDIINHKDCEEIDKREYRDAISGSIKYISSLTCVDGLVLMGKSFDVHGFGVEITSSNQPENIYLAKDENGLKLQKVKYEHFGTRHRSMMRYCFKNHGSIGFVVSQDGEIRVITRIEDKIIIWSNIKILNKSH